jgi:hypothetical protein
MRWLRRSSWGSSDAGLSRFRRQRWIASGFKSMITERFDVTGFEEVYRFTDTGFSAFIAIHDTQLGPALGGCRMKPYESDDQALQDVLLLAKGMTLKNSLASCQSDPLLLSARKLARSALGEFAHMHQRQHLSDARRDSVARPFTVAVITTGPGLSMPTATATRNSRPLSHPYCCTSPFSRNGIPIAQRGLAGAFSMQREGRQIRDAARRGEAYTAPRSLCRRISSGFECDTSRDPSRL